MSAARRLGAATRVVLDQAGRNRILSALAVGAKTTARSCTRVVHLLWLEVTGSIFLVMAAIGGIAWVREYAKYSAGRSSLQRLVLAAGFTLTFAWFGLSSFFRAHRRGARHD